MRRRALYGVHIQKRFSLKTINYDNPDINYDDRKNLSKKKFKNFSFVISSFIFLPYPLGHDVQLYNLELYTVFDFNMTVFVTQAEFLDRAGN